MTHAAPMNRDTSTSAPQPRPPAAGALPLALTVREDPAEISALWAMSNQQRIEAMWAGRLTLSQLCEWSSRHPSQVPLLGGEFAWIVMRTPEWADAQDTPQDNVIHLPDKEEERREAA